MTDESVQLDPAVPRFLDVVWMERGLSANTLAAYRADLLSLQRWLSPPHADRPAWDASLVGAVQRVMTAA